MKIIECTGCGGTLNESGKYFICENCGTRYAVGRDDEGNPFTYQPIEKKTIEYGTIEHKASHIEVNTLSVKEIKLDENVDVVVHKEGMNLEKQERIRLAKTFLLSREWNAAQDQVNNLLVEDNQCAEAKWFCLMLNHKAISDRELVAKLSAISENDRIAIDGILSNSSPIFARQILDVIFDSAFYNDDMCYALYSTAMPYAYNTSVYSEKELIDIKYSALETSVTRVFKRSFDYLLSITLNFDEVDKYISYLSRFASKCDPVSSQRYYSRILKVDPSNMDANHKMVLSDLQIDSPCEKIVNDFEHLLKFSDNTDNEVSQLLSYIVSEQTTTSAKSDFFFALLAMSLSIVGEGVGVSLFFLLILGGGLAFCIYEFILAIRRRNKATAEMETLNADNANLKQKIYDLIQNDSISEEEKKKTIAQWLKDNERNLETIDFEKANTQDDILKQQVDKIKGIFKK